MHFFLLVTLEVRNYEFKSIRKHQTRYDSHLSHVLFLIPKVISTGSTEGHTCHLTFDINVLHVFVLIKNCRPLFTGFGTAFGMTDNNFSLWILVRDYSKLQYSFKSHGKVSFNNEISEAIINAVSETFWRPDEVFVFKRAVTKLFLLQSVDDLMSM